MVICYEFKCYTPMVVGGALGGGSAAKGGAQLRILGKGQGRGRAGYTGQHCVRHQSRLAIELLRSPRRRSAAVSHPGPRADAVVRPEVTPCCQRVPALACLRQLWFDQRSRR